MTSLKSTQSLRICALSLLSFLIVGSYGLARPCIDSLFLAHHSSQKLPLVWLYTVGFVALVIAIYNRFNTRYSLLKLLGISSLLSASLLVLCLLSIPTSFKQEAVFALYIWKEVYMVLLIEIFWSFSDSTFNIKNARWAYGLLLGLGSFGGVLGNFFVGSLASYYGTLHSLWFLLPIFFLCSLICKVFATTIDDAEVSTYPKTVPPFLQSFQTIRQSQYLFPLLLMVAVIQIATTLIDFQFNTSLQIQIPSLDERTDLIGKTHAIIDVISVALQFFTGFILRTVSVSGTLLSIPFLLATSLVLFMAFPRFLMVVVLKIASKCFDYSLFRASKEILYIPLSHTEKTQGKALIDIFVYRLSKGFSSLLIMGLIAFEAASYVPALTLGFLIIWTCLCYVIVKRYRSIVSLEEEFSGT